jgi:hypothetical protein
MIRARVHVTAMSWFLAQCLTGTVLPEVLSNHHATIIAPVQGILRLFHDRPKVSHYTAIL